MTLRFSLLACLLIGLVHLGAAPCRGASSAPREIQDAERKVGPLRVGDEQFTVLLHEKQIRGEGSPDPDLGTTLASLEIVDGAGAVHYRKSFSYEVWDDRFAESLSASVVALSGEHSSGLLVTYEVLPSTPLGGQSWQVFGLREGVLVPFGKPLVVQGQLVNAAAGEGPVKTSSEAGSPGDTLEFRMWTGNFFVVYPVLVDWLHAELRPAWRCFRMTSSGALTICPYRVQGDRVPQKQPLTFVRLHPDVDEATDGPEHIMLRRDSDVALLGCQGEVHWEQGEQVVSLEPDDDFWIKVRIDGQEGWVHTQADLLALGLPQAG